MADPRFNAFKHGLSIDRALTIEEQKRLAEVQESISLCGSVRPKEAKGLVWSIARHEVELHRCRSKLEAVLASVPSISERLGRFSGDKDRAVDPVYEIIQLFDEVRRLKRYELRAMTQRNEGIKALEALRDIYL